MQGFKTAYKAIFTRNRKLAIMFAPWIKRKSLKRTAKGKTLVVSGGQPNPIMLLSIVALVVVVGVFAIHYSRADSQNSVVAPAASPSPSVTASPSPAQPGQLSSP